MRLIAAGQTLGLDRGAAVVCVPTLLDDRQTLATVGGVLEHCEPSVPILLAGPAATLEAIAAEIAPSARARIAACALPVASVAQAVNAAIRASHPCDLALVTPGVGVARGWLMGLRGAATSDSTVASATPLSLSSGALELDARNTHPRVDDASGAAEGEHASLAELEAAAETVADRALGLRPRIARIGPNCAYVRRAALELAGPLSEVVAFDRALTDMARSLSALGYVHVLADDVLVGDAGSGGSPRQGEDEDLEQQTISDDERGSLRRAVNIARTALGRLSVTVDARALVAAVGGTQTYLVELVLALARGQEAQVRVLVPPDLSPLAVEALTSVSGIELLTYEQALEHPRLTDVVHRPQQVFTPDDLALLRLVGERVVVGQQDLIAYHNPSYHRDLKVWRAYRRTSRLALASADQVVFFSEHARRDALAEDLLPGARAHVVGIGYEPPDSVESATPSRAAPADLRSEERFLLCLGADYAHKNRPFAIELLQALNDIGFDGRLVLAGSHVPYGSSREREAELLCSNAGLAERVLDLGAVDEAAKRWLYAHTRALLYPTIYEGFGLIPLEAARAGLPCLFAEQASLAELAPGLATLTPWDASVSAAAVLPLLRDGPAREGHLERLRGLSVPTWQEVARGMLSVYERALTAPASEAAPRAWQELDRERYIVELDSSLGRLKAIAQEYQDAYSHLEERVKFGLPLIDSGGLLSRRQQRGLMRVAARPGLGRLALAPFDAIGRGGDPLGDDERS